MSAELHIRSSSRPGKRKARIFFYRFERRILVKDYGGRFSRGCRSYRRERGYGSRRDGRHRCGRG